MPWVRLDDGYPEHPKVDRVGPLAAWLNVCAWAYCARNLTDGFVPAERVARLATVPNPAKLAAALVEANLWEPAQGGFLVHDYLSYNPSREQVLAERAKTAERVARFRNGSGNGVTPPDTNGVGNGRRTPVGNDVGTASPYTSRTHPVDIPNPDPEINPPNPPRRGVRRRVTEVDDAFRVVLEEDFYEAFGSRQAVRDVMDEAMGDKAVLRKTDQCAYLRNWVRRDAERAIQRRRGRSFAVVDSVAVDARESSPEHHCDVCGEPTSVMVRGIWLCMTCDAAERRRDSA